MKLDQELNRNERSKAGCTAQNFWSATIRETGSEEAIILRGACRLNNRRDIASLGFNDRSHHSNTEVLYRIRYSGQLCDHVASWKYCNIGITFNSPSNASIHKVSSERNQDPFRITRATSSALSASRLSYIALYVTMSIQVIPASTSLACKVKFSSTFPITLRHKFFRHHCRVIHILFSRIRRAFREI